MNVIGLVVAQDGATAAFALFNGAYFLDYWWRRAGARGRPRRVGALAMLLVSGAALAEVAFSQALLWWRHGAFPELSVGGWALVRLPLLVATAFVSLLILRRLRS